MVVFGSLVKDRVRESSALDLLIIKNTKKRPVDRVGEVLSICNHDIAFEPLVLTPKEIKDRLGWGDYFLEEILEQGEVVYERR